MTADLNTVAARLRHYREACALSQQQVAQALNVERSTYTKYENSASEPSLNTLVKLAAIFHVSPLALLPMDMYEEYERERIKETLRADSPIYQLTKDERGLIALYRVLDKSQKKQARELIGNMSKNPDGNSVK